MTGIHVLESAHILQVQVEYSTLVLVPIPETGIGATVISTVYYELTGGQTRNLPASGGRCTHELIHMSQILTDCRESL